MKHRNKLTPTHHKPHRFQKAHTHSWFPYRNLIHLAQHYYVAQPPEINPLEVMLPRMHRVAFLRLCSRHYPSLYSCQLNAHRARQHPKPSHISWTTVQLIASNRLRHDKQSRTALVGPREICRPSAGGWLPHKEEAGLRNIQSNPPLLEVLYY